MRIVDDFKRDRSGTVAVIFGLSLLPMALAMGSAVDYARSTNARTLLQIAVDTTALALARDAGSVTSDAELVARGQQFFAANFPARSDVALQPVAIARGDKKITVSAAGNVKTAFMGLVSIEEVGISAAAETAWGTSRIELAMVLDNTGSMGANGKMNALKLAANDLLATLEKAATEKDTFKVSIVPFDTQVNIGAGNRNASWLDYNPSGVPVSTLTNAPNWQGCVIDRDQPYDTGDTPPTIATPKTLYPAVKCKTGSLAAMRPLTTDFNALRTTIAAMQPAGYTNVSIGVAWGLASLSQSDPLVEAQAFGTKSLDKIMIVLTDGTNTQNRFTTNTSLIDDRTRLACNEVKKNNIKVYTIRVIDGNANLLRDCASSSNMYYDVKDAAQLNPVFQAIAGEIASIRLTQ